MLLLIRRDIKYTIIPLNIHPTSLLEVIGFKIAFTEGWVSMLFCYSPSQTATKEEFDHYFRQISGPQLIFGDFNARHTYWNPSIPRSSINISGNSLFETFLGSPCSLLNPPDLVTRIDPYTGKGSSLDLYFGSDFLSLPLGVDTGPSLGGDHLPVVLNYGNAELETIHSRNHWNFKNKSFLDYQITVSNFNEEQIKHCNIKDKEELIINHMRDSGKKHFYLGKGKICMPKKKPWWNEECSKAVALKRRAYNRWRKRPERIFQLEYRRLEAKARKIILKVKRLSWRKFLSTLNLHSTCSEVWNFFRSILGTKIPHSFPLSANGVTLIGALAKAELLASHFNLIIGSKVTIHEEHRKVEFIQSCLREESHLPINCLFTFEELDSQISKLKRNKSPGYDEVPNEFLINLPENIKMLLLSLFNESWETKVDLCSGKLSDIIPIFKHSKDPTLPNSYRPIALLSCLAKLFERLAYTRFSWWLEVNSLLPDHQYGFRSSRSTVDVLLQLEHQVYKGFKEKKVTLIIFFDLSNAFDRASHTGILYKFCRVGFRGNCLHYLNNFFKNRRFRVLLEDRHSKQYPINSGVPQGSVLSPLLFNVLLSDLPQSEDAMTFCFADDIAYSVTAKTVAEAQIQLQPIVNRFDAWSKDWGLIINPSKSRLMCFTRKRVNAIPSIKLNDTTVPFVTEHCWLGLKLDGPTLNWKKHIEYLKITCCKRLDIMKRLASKKWGASKDVMITFYKSFIRSKLDYGCTIYCSASKTVLKQLETIQNTAIRIATGAFKSSPVVSLVTETNILPLHHWRNLQAIVLLRKLQNYPFDSQIFQLFSQEFTFIHQFNWSSNSSVPFLVRASYTLTRLQLPWNHFSPLQVVSPLPPWFKFEDILKFSYPELAGNNKGIVNVSVESAKFKDFCNSTYKEYIHIYTDGSYHSINLSSSAALYIPDIDFTDSWHLSPENSIITAELFAIWQALLFVINNLSNFRVVVFTDSLSSLHLIKSFNLSHRNLILKIIESILKIMDRRGEIVIQWIPSHYGIPGNEFVDTLANRAHSLPDITKVEDSFSDLQRLCSERTMKYWLSERENILSLTFLGQIRDNVTVPFQCFIKERKLTAAIQRLRIGHTSLNAHLNRLNLVNSPDCQYCSEPETIEHVLLYCPRYHSRRVLFKQSLQKLKIQFTVPNILGKNIKDKTLKVKLYKHLAVFLKSTTLVERL